MAMVMMGFTGELCKVQIFALWRETFPLMLIHMAILCKEL